MPLASQSDVAARLGRQLTTTELDRLPSLIDDASAMVVGYCGQDFEPGPVPVAVVGVVAKAVARVIARATAGTEFTDQQTAGPFSVRFSAPASSGDVWLTAADKLALRPHRVGGGLRSVQSVGNRYLIDGGY